MKYRIKKVAVLGSGVMGSTIACHLANVGLDVIMLDIVPFNLSKEDAHKPAIRNSIVNGALKAALKSKPAALYSNGFANRISTGNFDDDLHKIADADWIIEVIIEKLDIKQSLFEKVEKYASDKALISSNTSSIPIHMLVEGRSDSFKKRFCGTHFFNPPRYMPLLEIIPHTESDKDVIDFFMDYGDRYLGKRTVLCKDTPGFIANRIGVMAALKVIELTEKHDMRIEEVDAIMGQLICRPKTAHYRLQDLVGIDTGDKVSRFVLATLTDDEAAIKFAKIGAPKSMEFLLENKFLGNKTKKGYYQRTKEKDANGKRIVLALNLKTLDYEPSIKPKLDVVAQNKGIELDDKRMRSVLTGDTREHKFLKDYFAFILSYVAGLIPEISDDIHSIDSAMRTGYMWEYGPFEYWDLIGLDMGISLIEEMGYSVPKWVADMKASGKNSFYEWQGSQRKYFDKGDSDYSIEPGRDQFLNLSRLGKESILIKNSEAVVLDIGDGVLCVEFRSKSNSIGEGVGNAIHDAIRKAEEEGWNGVVIGNNAKNFSVGANLMPVGMMAAQKQYDALDKVVDEFQQLTLLCRTSKVPVVLAGQGYVFGGGCELSMHCDATVMAAETYIGLVEVGVGLLPGGGGTKEMALRASDAYFDGDVQIPTLIEHFKPIAMATVATSAYEGFDHNLLLKEKDTISVYGQKNIIKAKQKVLELAPNYVAGTKREDITVLGRTGLSALYTAINEFRLGGYMSEYDEVIARKVAYVISGGDLTGKNKVSEQYLLDIEREAFLSLLGNQKTLDRINHILMYNKPLRN